MITSVPETSQPIAELFFNAVNIGEALEPRFVGRAASFECGAAIRVSLHVDDSQKITEAKFQVAGCSVLVAAASLLTSQVNGKTTAEAAAVGQDAAGLQGKLGPLPAGRNVCLELACEALLAAIRHYSDRARDDWEGDEALICTCFCVSERTIEHEIQAAGLTTIAAVTAACSAGGGCRSCYPLIQDILDDRERSKWLEAGKREARKVKGEE
jgi:NifU-like protein